MTRVNPQVFEKVARNGNVGDGQVMPLHPCPSHRLAELGNLEQRKVLFLDQGHDRVGAPFDDRLDVDAEVAVPSAAVTLAELLARTQGHPDPAPSWQFDPIDAQRRIDGIEQASSVQLSKPPRIM